MSRICGSKPMSSMRSASSITRCLRGHSSPPLRHALQTHVAALHQVQQPPRRPDQNVAAAVQRRLRLPHVRAAVDHRRGHARAVAELCLSAQTNTDALRLLVDLHRQLARGRQHQTRRKVLRHARARQLALRRTLSQHAADQRKQEARRLARTCVVTPEKTYLSAHMPSGRDPRCRSRDRTSAPALDACTGSAECSAEATPERCPS